MKKNKTFVTILSLAISIEEDEELKSMSLQIDDVDAGGKSSEVRDSLLEILDEGQLCLPMWRNTIEKTYPECVHDMPPPENITLKKCNQCEFTTDSCDQICETRNLVLEEVEEKEGKLYFNIIRLLNNTSFSTLSNRS